MPPQLTRFDWIPGKEGRVLRQVGVRNPPPQETIDLCSTKDETFAELYRKGYLTGRALRDAKKQFGDL